MFTVELINGKNFKPKSTSLYLMPPLAQEFASTTAARRGGAAVANAA